MSDAPFCADLHSHSTASDGRLAPAELADRAMAAGLDLWALTDHDTTAGLAAAHKQTQGSTTRFVPGVEISVTWQRRTLHIVGLDIDPDCAELQAGLSHIRGLRDARAQRMISKLERIGLPDCGARAEALAAGAALTRTHFARLLVEDHLAVDMRQAFKRYLKPGKAGYVASEWVALDEAIRWIHQAGGLAVIAHPLRYRMTASWRQRLLSDFVELGGDALEVCCGPSRQPADIQTCASYATQHGLLASIGSDFHDPDQPWTRLGSLPPLPTALKPVWSQFGTGTP